MGWINALVAKLGSKTIWLKFCSVACKCTPMAPPPDPGMWWRKKERNECNWKLNAMVWPSIGQTAATWPQSWPLIGCLGSRDARAGLWLVEISAADKYQSRSSDSFTLFVTALRVDADNHTSANLWSRDRKVDQHYQQIADIADTDRRYKPWCLSSRNINILYILLEC